MPENYLLSLKAKLQNTCEEYSNIFVPYKYNKKCIMCILKQVKGRGVVNGHSQICKQMLRIASNKLVYKTKP